MKANPETIANRRHARECIKRATPRGTLCPQCRRYIRRLLAQLKRTT